MKEIKFRQIYNKYKEYPSCKKSKYKNDMLTFIMSWSTKEDRAVFCEVNNYRFEN